MQVIEILVDLLIAHDTPGFQIGKCIGGGLWFVPNSRSRVSGFCSSRWGRSFDNAVKSASEFSLRAIASHSHWAGLVDLAVVVL
jgi:hypothetical protein